MRRQVVLSLLIVLIFTTTCWAKEKRFLNCCDGSTTYCDKWCSDRTCSSSCAFSCRQFWFWSKSCPSSSCYSLIPSCSFPTTPSPQIPNESLLDALRKQKGSVIDQNGEAYEERRGVFNSACTARPLVIVHPLSAEDVSIIVKTAKQLGFEISVRSGGHSYTCNSLKDGGVHIDLRELNKVELVNTSRSHTGLACKLGPGGTWGNVLKKIPQSLFSYPHGQCKSVGVGGFLLGGGVNWLGTFNKYGYGAEHILEMDVVLADGTIAHVYPNRTIFSNSSEIIHISGNDLFFGLRGAGSSLAIVTEFLYTVYRKPETKPAVLLIWLNNQDDFDNILKTAQTSKKYSFMVNQPISKPTFWSGNKALHSVMSSLPLAMKLLKIRNEKKGFPVQTMVTDIRPEAGRFTDVLEAEKELIANNVDVVLNNWLDLKILRMFLGVSGSTVTTAFNQFGLAAYEAIEKEQENWKANWYSSTSLNFGSLISHFPFQEEFLTDPYTGVQRFSFLELTKKSCDFCFWMIHYRGQQNQTSLSLSHPISTRRDIYLQKSVEINLTCMTKSTGNSCQSVVNDIKAKIEAKLDGQDYSKYYNFPSCSNSGDWRSRYWGDNVKQLDQIKGFWDPSDVFNHCQSLTSSDLECCPF